MPSTNVQVRFNEAALLDPLPLIEQCQALNLDCSMFANRANSYRTCAGKQPGIGYLLISRADLDSMPYRHQPVNQLSFDDITGTERSTLVLKGLRVISEQAIYPSFVSSHPEFTGPADPVLITVTDSRSIASTLPINWSYNLATPDDPLIPRSTSPLPDYTHLLKSIWEQKGDWVSSTDYDYTLKDVLGTLSILYPSPTTTKKLIPPYNLRFHGLTAFNAFQSALEATFGMSYYYASTNKMLAILGGATQKPADADLAIFQIFFNSRLINHEGRQKPIFLPETVTLHYHNYDYQWWRDPHSRTGLDRYTYTPVGTLNYSINSLAAGTSVPYQIVKGLNHSIWSPLPAWINDKGQISEAQAWFDYQQTFAEHHIRGYLDHYKWDALTFHGILPLEPTPGLFTAIAWFDYGHGFTTKVFRVPPHLFNTTAPIDLPNSLPTPSSETLQASPDLARAHIPTPRDAEGVLVYPPTLNKDYIGSVQLLAGEWFGDRVTWTQAGTPVEAANLTGTVKQGDRVRLRFNYQLRTGGGWTIVGNISSPGNTTEPGGPYVSLMAIGEAVEDSCGSSHVSVRNVRYVSPPPHTNPWGLGTDFFAENFLRYAVREGSQCLLWVNPANLGQPYLIAVENECVHMWDDFRFGNEDDSQNPDYRRCVLSARKYLTSVPLRKQEEKRTNIVVGDHISFLSSLKLKAGDCSIWGVMESACILGNTSDSEPAEQALINLKTIPEDCCPCQPCECADWPSGDKVVRIKPCEGEDSLCDEVVITCQEVFLGSALWDEHVDTCGISGSPPDGRMWYGTQEVTIKPEIDGEGTTQVIYYALLCCRPEGAAVEIGAIHETAGENTNGVTQTSFSCVPFQFTGTMDDAILTYPNDGRDFNCSPPGAQMCVIVESGGAGGGSGNQPVESLPATENYQNAEHLSSYHTADGNAYFGSHPSYILP